MLLLCDYMLAFIHTNAPWGGSGIKGQQCGSSSAAAPIDQPATNPLGGVRGRGRGEVAQIGRAHV